MKNIIVGAFALMISTLTMIPIVVAENGVNGDETNLQKVEADSQKVEVEKDKVRNCLIGGGSWSQCFSPSLDNLDPDEIQDNMETELEMIRRIINDASVGNLGVGLGTDSVAQSIRKDLFSGRL